MDELIVVGAVFAVLVIGGALTGWLSLLKIKGLEQRVLKLEAQLREVGPQLIHSTSRRQGVDKSNDGSTTTDDAEGGLSPDGKKAAASRSPIDEASSHQTDADAGAAPVKLLESLWTRLLHGASGRPRGEGRETGSTERAGGTPMARSFAVMREHWMILVGALSLVMAGVMLVGYSLEQGLLGPGMRLALGLGFGIGMIVLAEWLRWRTTQSPSLTGAVSGAGSLVTAASLLAGHYLLSLASPLVTFVLLALLSLWTLERARHHGPWLAALGMLGGYALPLALPLQAQLGGAASLMLLGHLGVIALACRLLHRKIGLNWLYWGGLCGALLWWMALLPLEAGTVDLRPVSGELERGLAALWLCLLAIAYLHTWRDESGRSEGQVVADGAQGGVSATGEAMPWWPWRASPQVQRHWIAGLLLGAVNAMSLLLPHVGGLEAANDIAPGDWLPSVLLLWVTGWTARHMAASWSMMVGAVAFWLLAWGWGPLTASGIWVMTGPMALCVGLVGLACWKPQASQAPAKQAHMLSACWWAMATLVPLVAWGLAVWNGTIPVEAGGGAAPWLNTAMPPLIWGLVCWVGANRFHSREGVRLAAGLWLPAQFGIALALVIALDGPSLTLALALQLLGLTGCEWRWWRLQADEDGAGRSLFAELARLLAWGVALRLAWGVVTGTYDDISHWPLQVFLPVLVCVALSSHGMRHRKSIQRWLEGVVVQLALATTVLEIRYLLTDGQPFSGPLSLAELSLQVLALAGVAAGYAWRGRGSATNVALYRLLASVVGGLAGIIWLAGIVLAFNPLWQDGDVGRWPLLNWLLPAYALPALGAALVWRLSRHAALLRRLCEVVGLLAVGLWIGLSLRHVWHGGALGLWHGVEQAELYAYSLALLAIAASLVIGGARMGQPHWQRVGQGLLVVTILKVGLWDTATLDGLWRVGSWLGLGTVLMLLSALFKRLAGAGTRREEQE
ncbi:DUF2339 domain-containing protein [Cobetia sp. 5-25-4-2]|uniref:DUF2339 domain-containing protein n=1 Tax=Cobetia sp. 5-25-4-2 TaxID=2737459 RepID=UPI0015969C13|nr:DUF2339 domain-containing protein [Cobetia sp. 5-25-4-2]